MRALLVLPILLAFVPTALAEDLDPVEKARSIDAVDCLLQPQIPEVFVYYGVWGCATGGALGEPIEDTTGCRVGFPMQLQCS